MKVSQEIMGPIPGRFQMQRFHCPLPMELWTVLLSQHPCVTTCTEYSQPEKLPQALASRVFTGAPSYRYSCLPAWLISAPLDIELTLHDPKHPP